MINKVYLAIPQKYELLHSLRTAQANEYCLVKKQQVMMMSLLRLDYP
jgi:hypothetical protein